ncbi:MAG: phosphomannomutase/phosphoglucomutase [Candidatus Hydrogenedentes bacterium]|nr:phosphomannomutase/phosphoglucomutase [Candidatus Hydrogenedentota bacterium]MBI3117928.1 phosphomannomutase/phosphoglucomutase [Candidatus Hydrogenedentota bacterium]
MDLNPTIFREYDIRGIAGRDLSEHVYERIGMAYVAYMRGKLPNRTVVVGRDGRLTGKAYSQALIDGITACGINIIDIGQVPTPVLYYALNTLKVDGGLMLTASHNPKEYNGLKVGVGKTTIYGEEIQKLRRVAEKGAFPLNDRPTTITRMNVTPKYIKRIVRDIKLKRPLRVVVDAANGVGGVVAVPLFEELGCEVVPLYCEVDGNFPNHHADPTKAENLKDLIRLVKAKKADVGIGFDGDVDRLGGCDENGVMLWGDRLLALFAEYILKDVPGATIIGEVKCSRSLYERVQKLGGNPVMWRTGHSHIKAAMKQLHAQIAGEMSGHIFFKHRWYGFDDAIYSAARLLEIVASSRKSLGELMARIPERYNTPEIEFDCPDTRKFGVIKEATRYFKDELGLDVVTIDGARIEFKDGWGLLRASNTSPKLVMRVEADTPQRVKEIRKLIEHKVKDLNR